MKLQSFHIKYDILMYYKIRSLLCVFIHNLVTL